MRVRHRIVIEGTCPVDGAADRYECDVFVLGRVLQCEHVVAAVEELTRGPVFQEALTQALADRLGAKVRTKGTHVGGRVQTTVVCQPKS